MVVFSLMIVFCFLAGIVKYPDILPAPVVINTENPAIRVLPEVSGRVEQLFVKDQDIVMKNHPLLLLESDAHWNDIQMLNNLLESSDSKSIISEIPKTLILGDIHSTYITLLQQIDEYQYFKLDQNYQTSVSLLQSQILHHEELNTSISKQALIFREEVKIVDHNYGVTKQLFNTGAASKLEVETAKLDYLSSQRQLENMESQMLNNQIRIKQLRSQIADIIQTRTNQKLTITSTIQTLLTRLKNELHIWEKKHLVRAPISGILSLSKIWSEEQFVEAQQPICTIIPKDNKGAVIVRAEMPAVGIGKIKVGTKANIRLTGFPEQEYGILRGEVKNIAMLPEKGQSQDGSYTIELALDDTLNTSYGKKIPLQQEMTGIAEIITEEKSILQRIINQSLHFIKNN
ncbi:MAG: HlyD family efflux transporter periplasmic adaptor subunit [Bacteroidota bacterium]